MLMKIGEVTNKLGISHRALRYWESAGILESTRGENGYRYYDEQNIQKIKQIVVLRKLRMSIPSIQQIFTSDELSKVVTVFTNHLDGTKKEVEQLNALGVVLSQLLNMLKDRQNMDSVYQYLDTTHSTESEELKAALKSVLSGPDKEITIDTPPEPLIDMTEVDLSLELASSVDIPELTDVVRDCYANTKDIDDLITFYDFECQFNLPDCTYYYKVMQNNKCIGVVNLTFTGMESMLIRNVAYREPDNNVFIFELLKQKHPDVLCWMMFFTQADKANGYAYHDCEMKKQQFRDDNGFRFYTSANDRDQYIKMMRPHDEVYNSSRYRFAIGLDDSAQRLTYRMCGLDGWDFYDNWMGNWRITDSAFVDALIYDNGMARGKFYKNWMTDCDFRYNNMENSSFINGNLKNCKIENCNIDGLTIDGIRVEEALEFYRTH